MSGDVMSSKIPQVDTGINGGAGYNPLSELMRAMILRVVDDYNASPELRESAVEYMFNNDDEHVFSFLNICRYFGIDPQLTRNRIMYSEEKIRTRRRAS